MGKIIFFIPIIFLAIISFGCGKVQSEVLIEESGKPIEVYFCPGDDCEQRVVELVNSGKSSIYCAFFDIDLEELISVLDKKSRQIDVKLVIDGDNYFNQTKGIPLVIDDKSQLSHNKFCVIDGKTILTGSFNPTINGNKKNNNNLVIVNSRYLL